MSTVPVTCGMVWRLVTFSKCSQSEVGIQILPTLPQVTLHMATNTARCALFGEITWRQEMTTVSSMHFPMEQSDLTTYFDVAQGQDNSPSLRLRAAPGGCKSWRRPRSNECDVDLGFWTSHHSWNTGYQRHDFCPQIKKYWDRPRKNNSQLD
jgi:hypothetical protein